MRTTSIIRTGIALATVAVLVAGCGGMGDSKPTEAPRDNGVAELAPDEALDRAKTALRNADSYRVKGAVQVDGQTMLVDFRVRGTDLAGKVTYEEASVELLKVRDQQFVRPDEKFWTNASDDRSGSEVAKRLGDKWLKLPADDEDFAGMFNAASVDSLLGTDATLTKGGTTEVNGVPTIGLVDDSADGGTLFVATEGEPYPMRMEGTASSPGELTLSDFGASFDEIKAPADTEVVDFEELTRRN